MRLPGRVRYSVRAGGPWLCRTVVLSVFQAVVVPSGLTVRVQPRWWIITWWWKKHSSAQPVRLVLPPWAWRVVWRTWQPAAGWLQPPSYFDLKNSGGA